MPYLAGVRQRGITSNALTSLLVDKLLTMTNVQSIGFTAFVAALSLQCATPGGRCMDSETCCLQSHPGNPAACGFTDAEAAIILAAAATATSVLATSSEGDDPDEGWRQHCIDNYVRCKSQKKPRWVGPCYDCLRNCEGQHQWPYELCSQSKR
ncbi:hypothetical protein HUA76_42340 [Myxococcus sp. CA056]|uniref:hypothetical protein n=1 Tax=Myxococcus sp. CA033 TaxID=2741516 RepID=UPI00157AA38E|nr:hypothetical protein [Myxococcus sp. CA033]NTX17431.1 hypothetical protein [Myxococcus sp. CA056]NTX39010.1 hypothetical protein [Myxococcus sp. CA033]